MHKKVAFIGSVGSGKTTIVENLSNTEALNTDVKSTESIGKELTTVGIDYGHIVLGDDITLGLYGVPGQRKFSMIWDFVQTGLWAIVILVKNNDVESINEINHLIEYFNITNDFPCLIAITHADNGATYETHDQILKITQHAKLDIPIYTIDPRRNSCAQLIMQTLIALEESL